MRCVGWVTWKSLSYANKLDHFGLRGKSYANKLDHSLGFINGFPIQHWNCTLQKEAQEWADRCEYQHSPNLWKKSENVGYIANETLDDR